MFDNEKIWTAALYVLAVSYAAYCSFIFGSLLASEPDTLGALLKFASTYGTMIAGVPVLVAVVVAKQQMDANRRQHVATIKRSFQEELDALHDISFFASEARDSSLQSASKNALNQGLEGLVIDCPDKTQLKMYRGVVPPHIAKLTATMSLETQALYEESTAEQPNHETIELRLNEIKTNSRVLLSFVDDRLKKLAENWS